MTSRRSGAQRAMVPAEIAGQVLVERSMKQPAAHPSDVHSKARQMSGAQEACCLPGLRHAWGTASLLVNVETGTAAPAPRPSSLEAAVTYDFLEPPRLQQRPHELNADGSGGWFAARSNGWTSCVEHVHGAPEDASRCWARATQ